MVTAQSVTCIRVIMLDRDENSSLFCESVNVEEKKVYNVDYLSDLTMPPRN